MGVPFTAVSRWATRNRNMFNFIVFKCMKKKCDFLPPQRQKRKFNLFLCMRMIAVLLLVGSLHLSAATFSQTKVSLTMKNAALEEIFQRLETITNYTFLYKLDLLKGCDRVDVDVQEKDFQAFLTSVLKPLGLSFRIDDRVVVITRDDEKKAPEEMVIKGKVIMKDSTTVPGATVRLKGASIGVITNMDGEFSLTIPKQENPVLIFSFVGLKTKEIKYEGKDLLIVMEEELKEMDEVVVTGYQRIRKSDMVGSSNSIKREDLFFDGTNSLEQMLQGKLPGMLVMNTSGLVGKRQKVRVRGTSTLLGNQEPVWVVDGIIQEDPLPFKTRDLDALGNISQDNFDMVKDFVGNAISWLNPNDIENITVLKDASATVMYGVKAANGVIVITTKRGKAGRMSVNYSGNFTLTPRLTYEKMNLMNSKERVEVSREIYERGLTSNQRPLESIGYEGVLKRYLAKEITYDEFDKEVKRLETINTDWFDILFRNTFSMNHSISLSGGSDKITYYGSVNANIVRGNSIGNESKTYSASVGIDTRFDENITLSLRLNGSTAETKGYYQVDPYGYAHTTSRVIPCFAEDGSRFFYQQSDGYKYNILNEIDKTGNKNTNRNMSLGLTFRWDIFKGLQFESTFGLNTSNVVGESFADEQSNHISKIRGYEFGTQRPADLLYQKSQLPHGGELNTTEDRNLNYTWRNMLSYNIVLAEKHRLSLMVGQECRSNKYDGISSTVYGYFPERGKAVSLPPKMIKDSEGKDIANDIFDRYATTVTDRKANYIGYFTSFSYGFNERYVLTASFRSDASNRFGQDTRNRFLPVWSVGGRWNVHYEPWMQKQRVISDLNFRVTYGWQGNVAENYGPDLIARMGSGSETIDQGRTGEYMLFIQSLPYGNLRWEKTKTINLGTDFGLFQNKIVWTIEYYYKRTEDMIVEKNVPYAYGVASMPINGGNMTNRGLEISAGFTPVRLDNFTWNVSVNTSKNFNKVESKMNENKNWRAATSGTLNKEGYAVSSFWAFDFIGLNPENGSAEFNIPTAEENANVNIDATEYMKYMGTMEPDFSGGLSMSFRYKTLSLSTSFNLNIGGKKFLYPVFADDIVSSTPSAYINLPQEMTKRWRKPGDEKLTDIPSLPSASFKRYDLPGGGGEYSSQMYNYSDVRVVNASFLRCNSLALSYTLPEKFVRKMFLKNLSFSASVSNPFMIVSKDFKGMDPEVATGSQPISRTWSLGVNISL